MRRGWVRALLAVLVLALMAAGVSLVLLTWSSSELVAGALARLLDRRVELGAVRVQLGPVVRVELTDLEIWDEAGEAQVLVAPRAVGSQTWPRLFGGQLLPPSWAFDKPVVHVWSTLGTGAGGSQSPPQLPPVDLTVRDGTLLWSPLEGEPIRVERLNVTASRAALRAGVVGSAIGQVNRGERSLASFALDFDGWFGGGTLRGSVEQIDLTAFDFGSGTPSAGIGSATLATSIEDGVVSGSLQLSAQALRVDLPGWRGPIAPSKARLETKLRWEDGALDLDVATLALDDLILSGPATLRTRGPRWLRAYLDIAPFQPGQDGGRLQLLRLVGLRHQSWADNDARVEAGWVEDIHFHLDVALAEVGDVLAFRRPVLASEFGLEARLRDVTYRPRPESPPLEEISAGVELRGNELSISQLHIVNRGNPIPEIDLHLSGMHVFAHLPAEERRLPPGPGVPIPGLGPAFSSLRSDGDEPETVVRLHEFQIGYTPFLLPFRDGDLVLTFPDGNLRVNEAIGAFGGRPARIEALWDRARNHIEVDIEYREGEAPPPGEIPAAWASGRFSMKSARLGLWPLYDVGGSLLAEKALVNLTGVEATLEQGHVQAEGTVSLERQEEAPFGFAVEIEGSNASGLSRIIGMDERTLSGEARGSGNIRGKLRPDHEFLEDAEVRMSGVIKGGTLGNLPATLVIARLASPLGWTGLFGRPLPYDEMAADFEIKGGVLRTENFAVTGPELRMLAAGEIDLLTDDLQSEMVVALLFLRSVDQVIGMVPIVGTFLLGENRNLVTVYFKLEGPWEDPRGRLLPPSTIQTAAGWAGKVIGAGVRRVRDILSIPGNLLPGRPGPKDGEAPRKENGSGGTDVEPSDGASAGEDPGS